MLKNKNCNYCGWKFPTDFIQRFSENSDSVFCENCGTELLSDNPIIDTIKSEERSNQDLRRKKKKKKKTIYSKIYEKIRIEKNPIARVSRDSDFTKIFKNNFLIVMSRIIYTHLRAIELETAIDIKTMELTKEILAKLYKEISPVLSMRIKRKYLGNLHKIKTKDFEKWLKKLQTKLELNKNFHQDFILYLRWLIKKVYIIVSELWDVRDLPKFERIIRDDLKSFTLHFNFLNENQKIDNLNGFVILNEFKKANILNRLSLEDLVLEEGVDLIHSGYNTLDFIEDLREEILKIVPKGQLWRGGLSYDKVSKYLGMHTRYLRDTRHRIKDSNSPKHNSYFVFSKDQLGDFITSLSTKFGKDKITKCIELIMRYQQENNILDYRQQQWQIHNPRLKYDFFKTLDNIEKGYYFGLLLADGISDSKKNIGLFLEKEDIKVIQRFQEDLQISNKIENVVDKRIKKKSGEFPERYGIRVGCKPMMDNLEKLGFFNFKSGNALEEGFFTNLREDVRYSILLGFYDGDGEKGTSKIISTNKKFLDQIKREFNIINNVRLSKKAEKNKFVVHSYSDTKDSWTLSVGGRTFNKMMESYSRSMERKRLSYPMGTSKNACVILEEIIHSKENLERLLYIAPISKLMEFFGVGFETFKKLTKKWGVSSLPSNYWKRSENMNWKESVEDKFNDFKLRYLGEEF